MARLLHVFLTQKLVIASFPKITAIQYPMDIYWVRLRGGMNAVTKPLSGFEPKSASPQTS
jgi:hypothetical protein